MTVACIVQARLGSTRLPAKVLLPLPTGRTVLEEVLWRCKQIPGIDVVVCAIPDALENNIVANTAVRELGAPAGASVAEKLATMEKGCVVRGSEHDVLARYELAARAVKADIIMRITADCPLIDPVVCGQVLSLFHEENVDYCSNVLPRSYPQGLDCEVFKMSALRETARVATAAFDREHVTTVMQDTARCSRANLRCEQNRSHLRWTLDTLEDYVVIWNVMQEQMREAA